MDFSSVQNTPRWIQSISHDPQIVPDVLKKEFSVFSGERQYGDRTTDSQPCHRT